MHTTNLDALTTEGVLKRKQQNLKFVRGNKKLPKKLPKIKYPKMIELDYFRAIKKKVLQMTRIVQNRIIPRINDYKRAFNAETGLDSVNMDVQWSEMINSDIRASQTDVEFFFNESSVNSLVVNYAEQTSSNNKTQLNKQVNTLLGIDLFQSEPYLEGLSSLWIEENVALITSIPEKYFSDLEYMLKDSIRNGVATEEIASNIRNSVNFNKRDIRSGRLINPVKRSALIARDQIASYFGQLSQYRQLSVGVEYFVWDAVNDGRTRPEHAARDGKTYSWLKGANGIYPGQEIQCRCLAQPDWSFLG